MFQCFVWSTGLWLIPLMKVLLSIMQERTDCIVSPQAPQNSQISNSAVTPRYDSFPRQSFFFFLLLLCFFFLSINISTVPRTTRALHNDLGWRTQGNSLLLTILSVFPLPWLTFTFCFIAPFPPSRWNRLATDSTLWHQEL